jgi:lipopolysaccharide export system protein LptA
MIHLNDKVNTNRFPLLWRGLAKGILFLFLLFFIPLLSYSQNRVEILNAGSLKFANNIAEGAKRLIGDVQFKHENTLMYCDSAYFYADNSLDAFGHVRIQQNDGINLYGDLLKYSGNTKTAVLTRNVIVSKGDMQLTTDVLNYDISTGIGYYTTPGRIISKDNVLTSDRGSFFSKTNDFNFKKNVVLTNPQFVINCDTMRYNTQSKITYFLGPTTVKSKENLIYCEDGWYDTNNDLSRFNKNAYILSKEQKMIGDSLYYDRKQGIGRGYNNIQIIDTTQNITIKGNYAIHYELTGLSYVTGNAVLVQRYEKDTLYLHADTLKAVSAVSPKSDGVQPKLVSDDSKEKNKDSKKKKQKNKDLTPPIIRETAHAGEQTPNSKKLFAYHKVKFFKNDMQGKCDSLVYMMTDSTMKLYGRPIIWSEQNQLTADSMKIQTGNKAIQSIELKSSGFIVSMEDSIHYNQIRGKYMRGVFKKNDLYLIKVEGNGQTIYYDKEKETIKAVNRADCSNLNIYLKDKKIHHITFITKPEATLYPLNLIDAKDLKLKNFNWRGNEQPLKIADIFTW